MIIIVNYLCGLIDVAQVVERKSIFVHVFGRKHIERLELFYPKWGIIPYLRFDVAIRPHFPFTVPRLRQAIGGKLLPHLLFQITANSQIVNWPFALNVPFLRIYSSTCCQAYFVMTIRLSRYGSSINSKRRPAASSTSLTTYTV